MYLNGEARVGEGNEVAHIDLIIGYKEGHVGQALANALANQMHTPLFALIAPNLMAKPLTLMVPKFSIRGMVEVVKIYGPAQRAIAMAVVDSVYNEVIPEKEAEDICMVCGVLIQPEATDSKKIYENNYEAMKLAIRRAFANEPSVDEILSEKDSVEHPFYRES